MVVYAICISLVICLSSVILLLFLSNSKIFFTAQKVIRSALKRKVVIKTIVQACDCYTPDLAVPASVRSYRPKATVNLVKQRQKVLYEWSPNFSQLNARGTCSSEDFGTAFTKFRWVLGESGHLHLYLISSPEKSVYVWGDVGKNEDGAFRNISSFSGTLHLDDDEGDRLFWTDKVLWGTTVTKIMFEEVNVRQLLIQHEHYKKLAYDLLSLKNGNFTTGDLILKTADGEEFPVHANILAARSTAFADKLEINELTNAENRQQIEIKNISGAIMKIMLKYIYSGEISNEEIQRREVLSAAHQFGIPLLVEKCIESNTLSVKNAARFYYLADFHYLPEIKETADIFIHSNLRAVQQTVGWTKFIAPNVQFLEEFCDSI